MTPCISDRQGEITTEFKGFMRFLRAVARQFSSGMVCHTRTAINYGYFIALTLQVFGSTSNDPSASGSNKFLQPLK